MQIDVSYESTYSDKDTEIGEFHQEVYNKTSLAAVRCDEAVVTNNNLELVDCDDDGILKDGEALHVEEDVCYELTSGSNDAVVCDRD